MKRTSGILSVARKETRHIWRDKLSMLILFGLPGLIVGVFGFVLSFEIKEVPVAVLNAKHDAGIERLFQKIDASPCFHVVKSLSHSGEIIDAFASHNIKMVVVADHEPAKALVSGDLPEVHIFMDGSESKLAIAAGSITRKLIASFFREEFPEATAGAVFPEPTVRFLYNPELRREVMPIPGLMMIIFILISAIMLSVSIVKEKEQGTLKLLALTPVLPSDMVFGKSLPYLFITIFHIFSVLLINYFVFGMTIAGSSLHFLALNLLFAVNSMAFGLLIASRVQRQIEVAILCWLFLFIPNVFLSGFIFPLITMPDFLQTLAWLMPGTSFIEAYRGIVFKGTGWLENALPFALLLAQIVLVLAISARGFKHQKAGR